MEGGGRSWGQVDLRFPLGEAGPLPSHLDPQFLPDWAGGGVGVAGIPGCLLASPLLLPIPPHSRSQSPGRRLTLSGPSTRGPVCCRSRRKAAAGPAPGGERAEREGGPVQPAGGGEEVRAAPGPVLGGHSQSLAEDGSGPAGPNPASPPCTGCVTWAGDTSPAGLSPPICKVG